MSLLSLSFEDCVMTFLACGSYRMTGLFSSFLLCDCSVDANVFLTLFFVFSFEVYIAFWIGCCLRQHVLVIGDM